ncbi:MAG: hypothetical protein ACI8RY_001682 [Urechidicola sp.]|jgi:hypothetical protein
MYKIIAISFFLFSFCLKSYSQDSTTSYVGINLPPMIGSTIELGYEINSKPYLTFDVYGGYTFNSKLNGFHKLGDGINFSKKSGGFIKFGARINGRKKLNKFAPFIGLNIVNAISIEEGEQEYWISNNNKLTTYNESFKRNNYNLGISGIIGVTSSSTKRINIDLGIQIGRLLVGNLSGYHSYMPGMGTKFSRNRVQGILRVKYKIK